MPNDNQPGVSPGNRGGQIVARRRGQIANRRFPRSELSPVRITAWLQAPVISDASLPIDGVLHYLAHREMFGGLEITIPGADRSHPGVTLPLARRDEHCPRWYYAASFAQWGPVAEGQDHWNCRLDTSLAYLIDFRGRRGTIDIGSSAYRSYHMPVYYRHAVKVWWYAVGHPGELRRLLRLATHLGKKTAQGWGSVLRWEVEPWPEDWSVRGPDGRLMRAIPADHGLLMGYRPSYWLPANQTLCEVPE